MSYQVTSALGRCCMSTSIFVQSTLPLLRVKYIQLSCPLFINMAYVTLSYATECSFHQGCRTVNPSQKWRFCFSDVKDVSIPHRLSDCVRTSSPNMEDSTSRRGKFCFPQPVYLYSVMSPSPMAWGCREISRSLGNSGIFWWEDSCIPAYLNGTLIFLCDVNGRINCCRVAR